MSNRICGKCKSHKVADLGSYAGSTFYKCEDCEQVGMRDKFPEMTLFDRINASPEVLAEKLVYRRNCKIIHQDDKSTMEYWTYSWKSSVITGQSFETKPEAIAATVAKLKEVYNGQQ